MGITASRFITKTRKGKTDRFSAARMDRKHNRASFPDKGPDNGRDQARKKEEKKGEADESSEGPRRTSQYQSFTSFSEEASRNCQDSSTPTRLQGFGGSNSDGKTIPDSRPTMLQAMTDCFTGTKAKLDKRKQNQGIEQGEKSVQACKEKRDQEANETSKRPRGEWRQDLSLDTQEMSGKKEEDNSKPKPTEKEKEKETIKIKLKMNLSYVCDETTETMAAKSFVEAPASMEEEDWQLAEALTLSDTQDATAMTEEAIVARIMRESRREYEASYAASEGTRGGNKAEKPGSDTSELSDLPDLVDTIESSRDTDQLPRAGFDEALEAERLYGDGSGSRSGSGNEADSANQHASDSEEQLPWNPNPNWYNDRSIPEIFPAPSTSNPLGRYSVQHLHRVLDREVKKHAQKNGNVGERKGG